MLDWEPISLPSKSASVELRRSTDEISIRAVFDSDSVAAVGQNISVAIYADGIIEKLIVQGSRAGQHNAIGKIGDEVISINRRWPADDIVARIGDEKSDAASTGCEKTNFVGA